MAGVNSTGVDSTAANSSPVNSSVAKKPSRKPNQLLNAVGLYLGGVLTLAVLAYGCKALLGFL